MQSTPNLYNLIDMTSPDAILEEVKTISSLINPTAGFDPINIAYRDVLRLFAGGYPGYKKSNTGYHDLFHTTDVMLASARLVHGAATTGIDFSAEEINRILLSAMMHDTGYIQRESEKSGTGAQYTAIHIDRSIDFITGYFRNDLNIEVDLEAIAQILRCTGLNVRIDEIPFKSERNRFLGFVLGTADLLGQMADRYYVEKLPILYNEFMEGRIPGFASDFDLMKKTTGFYKMAMNRFKNELGSTDRFMKNHFRARWNMPVDLYAVAIERNMDYLTKVVENGPDYKGKLKRDVFFRAGLTG
jgi:hypothetical protein